MKTLYVYLIRLMKGKKMKYFLFLLLLSFFCSSQVLANNFSKICVDDYVSEECFLTKEEALAYIGERDEYFGYERDTRSRTPGRVQTDNPSPSQLMSAAMTTMTTMDFEGHVEIEVISPSGYRFIVRVYGRKKPARPMYSKPEGDFN